MTHIHRFYRDRERFLRIAEGQVAYLHVEESDKDYQAGDGIIIYGPADVVLRDKGRFAGKEREHVSAVITHYDHRAGIIAFRVLKVVTDGSET